MINDLERAVAHAESGLQVEVPLLRERISSLDPAKRLSPALFHALPGSPTLLRPSAQTGSSMRYSAFVRSLAMP